MLCELQGNDEEGYTLHHYFGPNDSQVLRNLIFNRNEMRTHFLSFHAETAIHGLEVSSQQFVSAPAGIDVEDPYTQVLFFNDDPGFKVNINQLGNVELKVRGELHNHTEKNGTESLNLHIYDAPGRVNQIGYVTVIPIGEEELRRRNLAGEEMRPHYAMLRFNFYQIKNLYEYYSFADFGRDCVVLAAFLGFMIYVVGALSGVYFFQQFFYELGEFILRKYREAHDWKQIQKYLLKFRKIHTAMKPLTNFQDILDEIDNFINLKFEDMSYEKTSTTLKQMKIMD